jgi:hypothetical protein
MASKARTGMPCLPFSGWRLRRSLGPLMLRGRKAGSDVGVELEGTLWPNPRGSREHQPELLAAVPEATIDAWFRPTPGA